MIILLGLLFGVVGSFVGAITYRIPRGEGFIKGRSYCDSCKKSLPWYCNIPLFSYIFLGGKSLCCKKEISLRYFVIELASIVIGLYLYLLYSNVFILVLFFLTLSVFVIDLEHQIIPDSLVFLCFFVSLFLSFSFGNLLAGFALSLVFLFLNAITKGRGMGMGDVKLVIPLGYLLGLGNILNFLFISFLTGGVVASILLISKKAGMKSKIAFGPFLIVSFWIVYIYGGEIAKWIHFN